MGASTEADHGMGDWKVSVRRAVCDWVDPDRDLPGFEASIDFGNGLVVQAIANTTLPHALRELASKIEQFALNELMRQIETLPPNDGPVA